MATSLELQPIVEVFFTVKMNTFARTTTEIDKLIIPEIKLDIFVGFFLFTSLEGTMTQIYINVYK